MSEDDTNGTKDSGDSAAIPHKGLLLGALGAIILVVIVPYFYAFAPDSWLTLSRDPERWAQFGEYVGGTLGPIFAVLAFLAVMHTIIAQKRQATLDEFQRQMATLSARIEMLLSERPPDSKALTDLSEQIHAFMSIYSLLAKIGNEALFDLGKDSAVQLERTTRRELALTSIRRQLAIVEIELQHLVWCLNQYADAGGDEIFAGLYRRKYQPVVCWLRALGLHVADTLEEYFKPEEFRKALVKADA